MNIQKINVQQAINNKNTTEKKAPSFGVMIKPVDGNVLDDFLDSFSSFSKNPLNKIHQNYIQSAKKFFDEFLENLVHHNATPSNHILDGGKTVFIKELKLTAGSIEKDKSLATDFLIATSKKSESESELAPTIPLGITPNHSIIEISTQNGDIFHFDGNSDAGALIQRNTIARINKDEIRHKLLAQLNV